MRWFISRHALHRMKQMDLRRDQVIDILNDPEVTWGDDVNRTSVKGEYAVAHRGDVVVTVLYHTQEQYERTDEPE